jgi:hypothetical protein
MIPFQVRKKENQEEKCSQGWDKGCYYAAQEYLVSRFYTEILGDAAIVNSMNIESPIGEQVGNGARAHGYESNPLEISMSNAMKGEPALPQGFLH